MNNNSSIILGYIGSSLVSINLIPQIITIIKKQSGKNISYLTCFTNIIACSLMLVYGIVNKLIPVIMCNSMIMLSSIIIASLKKYYNFINKKSNDEYNKVENKNSDLIENFSEEKIIEISEEQSKLTNSKNEDNLICQTDLVLENV